MQGGGAGEGGRWHPRSHSEQSPFFRLFFFFSNNPSKIKPFFKYLSPVLRQLSIAEQVAIANFNGYYISIQESANDMLAKALALTLPRD